jgi:hypothetical protein
MGVEKIFVLFFAGIVTLVLTTVAFRKTLYIWVLLAGAIGIPVLIVRNSHLMLSELLLAPLLFHWFMERRFRLGLIRLSRLSRENTDIEKSMWALIGAFAISSVFNIIFKDPSVGGEHVFIIGKLMALFLYVAPIMAALLIADSIHSIGDVIRICYILIALGVITFIAQLPFVYGTVKILKSFVGWSWMNVSILFSFSLAYILLHPRITIKLQHTFIFLIIAVQVFSAYFLGIATYKAIIIANYIILVTVFYYRSRVLTLLVLCISIILFMASVATFTFYLDQEKQEGSWGSHGSARVAIWRHSLSIFKERPLFGIGPYSYYDYSLHVAEKKRERDSVITSPHGQYVQILVETGIIGALAFLWFMIKLFKLLKYFLKLSSDHRVNIIAAAIAAVLVSRLTIGIIGDYLIAQYHNAGLQSFCVTVYFWVCLGVLIGLKKVVTHEDQLKEVNGGTLIEIPNHA